MIISLLFLGAALSPLAAGRLSDRSGRSDVLLFAMLLESAATAGLGLKWSPRTVLLAGILVLLAGITLVNLSPGRAVLTVMGVILTGAGIGPVTPTFFAMVGRTFSRQAGSAIGFTQTVGVLGAVLFPWLGGNLMGRFGPAIAVRLILFTAIAIALVFMSVRARTGESAARDTRLDAGGRT